MEKRKWTSNIKLNVIFVIAVAIGIAEYFFDMYGIQGLYRVFVRGIFGMCMGLIFLCVLTAGLKKLLDSVRENRSKTASIISMIFFQREKRF
ncbi:MAG: hypothetical protein SPJ62_10745 [Inconstantimicrobium porci]|uniref:Uncharacterized protein n=1 Tax=Inconstantimicrobium porci TaxID=2652291 RepID=A0A7X2MWE8_9CLOT|nr:hypothetical protein [Inconstantimicrobium porci]MDD6770511.1 hypothetical protein [Inconstantimicrobium porci]MDY5912456.1 hypothetical protein [Inconstantimicrobium porci]MSR90296.1 hypothetical protein [Inconstantimicrobium porci]